METWFDTIRPIRIPRPKLMSNRTVIDNIDLLNDDNPENMATSIITSVGFSNNNNGNHNNVDLIVSSKIHGNGSIENEPYPR
ncbi:hypothetical protein BLA29_010295 [Euroglyphus maynei]|uniref:Uncharacterized protein n=1 Tax=Euroglyphus maynei TaxID=6958 RepID=A0A1Y3BVT5_EURMA|nr:hypothetical protein BLA29_010295 [Euroglyphus maynei]